MSEHLILVIDCLKLTMPQWIETASITEVEVITGEELCRITDYHLLDVENLSPEDKSIAHRRFTMLSGILPVIGDKDKRSTEIRKISELSGISKQSIRNYLCLYLAYQNITVLAPKHRFQDLVQIRTGSDLLRI